MKNPPLLGRRTFLKATGGIFAAAALGGRPFYGSVEDVQAAPEFDGQVDIPFMEAAEVLICGSTLFACQLALDLALSGKKTILVMERVNPFFEGISCLRSWVDSADVAHFPTVVRGVLEPATSETKEGRTYFNASRAAVEIEDRLIEAGVRFIYNACVSGALARDGQLCGVIFGGKMGLVAIESALIVDATPSATVARAAGVPVSPSEGPARFDYVADLASPVAPRKQKYTAQNGAEVNVDLHHYYAAFEITLPSRATGPFAASEDFEQVYAAALDMPWIGAEKRFRGADGFLSSSADLLAAKNGRVEAFPNLFVFGPMGIEGNRDGSRVLKNWKALFEAFPKAVEEVCRVSFAVPNSGEYEFWNKAVPQESAPVRGMSHTFHDHGFDEPGSHRRRVRFSTPQAVVSSDVCVIGGGTSGNAAAYTSATLGLQTVCLERGFELGGTNTVGGVTNLWFGNHTKAFSEYYAAMGASNNGLNAPGFFKGLQKSGARILFGSVLAGVARRGRVLERVYVITPFGLVAVSAPKYIDATGDGSVAAWAGCAYSFGGEHDELTLWASFAGYKPGRQEALRPFLSPCDERSAVDATRFILSMRRNSKISLEQAHVPPPFYLAPRESRHIRGGKTLTFLDLLAGRRFKDGVFRVESNPDIKGLATSDAAKAGLIPTDWKALYQATVPYAAMLPGGLDNVIIAGKAYSATHDALSAARMQRDLCVMGMVAATAVLIAAKKKVLLREVPIEKLQTELIRKGMLKPTDISDDDLGFGMTAEEMAKKVATTSNMDEALSPTAMLCLLPRDQALKALEPFLNSEQPTVHRLLCFLGVAEGRERYLAQTALALNEKVLSEELFGGKATKHMMPDQGYAPVAALMLGSLARAGDVRAVPLLVKLAERIDLANRDLRAAWGYFYSLACGFERLACSEGKEPLKRVLASQLFAGCVVSRSEDLRRCSDIVSERLSYLKMALSRALLRCGDQSGASMLCEFLNEGRVCLARAARSELVAATGKDFGFSTQQWRLWIQQEGHKIVPNALPTPFA